MATTTDVAIARGVRVDAAAGRNKPPDPECRFHPVSLDFAARGLSTKLHSLFRRPRLVSQGSLSETRRGGARKSDLRAGRGCAKAGGGDSAVCGRIVYLHHGLPWRTGAIETLPAISHLFLFNGVAR